MNPFTPSFGTTPPALVGRAGDLGNVRYALEHAPGDPYAAVKVVGLRGVGKTVFLNAVEDEARNLGWVVLSETAKAGVAERLTATRLARELDAIDPGRTSTDVTSGGVTLGPVAGNVEREVTRRYAPQDDLRSMLERLAGLLEAQGGGVLITMDEMNMEAAVDLATITDAVQHCFRAGLKVAFVGAGLRSEINRLLDLSGTTYLRRAEEIVLGVVNELDVRRGLRDPIKLHGGKITDEALDVAVAATKGYPYMIQLIGYWMWRTADDGAQTIDPEIAARASEYALRRVGDLVIAPELRSLAPGDRAYLAAMAAEAKTGAIRTGAVAQTLGVNAQYAGVYRKRLIDAGLITATGHGEVEFVVPAMKEYLQSHVATEFLADQNALLPPSTVLEAGPQL